MIITRNSLCFIGVILLIIVGCKEEQSNADCGTYGSRFRFIVVDKASGQNLFFGDRSLYTEDDLKLYVITRPKSQDPTDTIDYLFLNTLERDSGKIFNSFLPARPNEDQTVYARINGADIDTLLITSRSDGYYDNGSCERIVADKVYYNNELVCSSCDETVSYIIQK